MNKKLYNLCTTLSIIGLLVCLFFKGTYYNFNSNNVKNNIEYLSSNSFKGRLAGTKENKKAADEISAAFQEYGLEPLSSEYEQYFNTIVPSLNNEKTSLKLLDNSNLVKEFKLGIDFKENFINFKKSSITFTPNDRIDIYNRSFSIFHDGEEYLFYVSTNKDFSFRSSFLANSKYGFAIEITTDTFSQILDSLRDGNSLQVTLPYCSEEKSICNVAGKIKGTSSKNPPLIITAHFDHLGCDTLNNIYYGALDNASGVCFLLELARNFSTIKLPNRDIIFVALNGEELGLVGSNEFANKYKEVFKDATVLNFDMIGASNVPITLMTNKDSSTYDSNVLSSLETICTDKNIEFLESHENASDHVSFINNGFDAVTLSHAYFGDIHTPKDTFEKISTTSIKEAYNLSSNYISNYCYNSLLLILYKDSTLICFFISSSLLISMKLFKDKIKFFHK